MNQQGKLKRNKETQENPTEYGMMEDMKKKDLWKEGPWLGKGVEAAENKSDEDWSMFAAFSKIEEAGMGFPLVNWKVQLAFRILPRFFFFLIFIIYLFIYLFMAVLGLRFCARAFSSCGKRGPLLIAVRGPLTIAAFLVAEHRLQTRRLSNCGSRAQLLRGMWDLPRPGLEPVSPALAGRLPTTVPPGKPFLFFN